MPEQLQKTKETPVKCTLKYKSIRNTDDITDNKMVICSVLPNKDKIYYRKVYVENQEKRQYFLSSDSRIDANYLVEEMHFIINNLSTDACINYVKCRYGIDPFHYQLIEFEGPKDPAKLVLQFTSIIRRKLGSKICMLRACSQYPSYKNEKAYKNFLPSNKEYLFLTNIYEEQEKIFNIPFKNVKGNTKFFRYEDIYLEERKTTITYNEFSQLVRNKLSIHEPKFLNFIFGEKNNKNLNFIKPDARVVLPSVYKVISATRALHPYISKETKVTSKKGYRDNTFEDIRGILKPQAIHFSQKEKNLKIIREPNRVLDSVTDELLEKSYILNNYIKNLYYIDTVTLQESHRFSNIDIDFNDPEQPFLAFKEFNAGTSRYDVIEALDAYPLYVWEEYFSNTGNPSNTSSVKLQISKSYLVQLLTADELSLVLFNKTMQYSKLVGLESCKVFTQRARNAYPKLSIDLFQSAQSLVSMAYISDGSTYKKKSYQDPIVNIPHKKIVARYDKDFINALDKNRSPIYKNTQKLKCIKWPQFIEGTVRKYPLMLSFINPVAMAVVANHHDHAENMFDDELYKEYCTRKETTVLYTKTKSNLKTGNYSSFNGRLHNAPITPGFGTWLKAVYKETKKHLTDFNFITGNIYLEELESTKEEASSRYSKSMRAKKIIRLLKRRKSLIVKIFDISKQQHKKDKKDKLAKIYKLLDNSITKLELELESSRSQRRLTKAQKEVIYLKEYRLFCEMINDMVENDLKAAIKEILSEEEAATIDTAKVNHNLKISMQRVIHSHVNETKNLVIEDYLKKNNLNLEDLAPTKRQEIIFEYVKHTKDMWVKQVRDMAICSIKFSNGLPGALEIYGDLPEKGIGRQIFLKKAVKHTRSEDDIRKEIHRIITFSDAPIKHMVSSTTHILDRIIQPAYKWEYFLEEKEKVDERIKYIKEQHELNLRHAHDPSVISMPELPIVVNRPGISKNDVGNFFLFIEDINASIDKYKSISIEPKVMRNAFNQEGMHPSEEALENLGCDMEYYAKKYDAWIRDKEKKRIKAIEVYYPRKKSRGY